jgi:hypothetical protein
MTNGEDKQATNAGNAVSGCVAAIVQQKVIVAG